MQKKLTILVHRVKPQDAALTKNKISIVYYQKLNLEKPSILFTPPQVYEVAGVSHNITIFVTHFAMLMICSVLLRKQ